mmetsp:Transcript_38138/g.81365  ORF Transcript_38138/g.81365 Transcript_38138/m.81365 type:complete len:207 (-) Transcript_38138:65-685(-)
MSTTPSAPLAGPPFSVSPSFSSYTHMVFNSLQRQSHSRTNSSYSSSSRSMTPSSPHPPFATAHASAASPSPPPKSKNTGTNPLVAPLHIAHDGFFLLRLLFPPLPPLAAWLAATTWSQHSRWYGWPHGVHTPHGCEGTGQRQMGQSVALSSLMLCSIRERCDDGGSRSRDQPRPGGRGGLAITPRRGAASASVRPWWLRGSSGSWA